MPKLNEVIEMFGQLGMPEDYVRQALAAGDSAHNAFEGLKTCLQIQWDELRPALPEDRRVELQAIYDRLMMLNMTARTLPPPKVKREDQDVLDSVDRFKPWALVLKDMLDYDGDLTLGQQITTFCARRGLAYPPPEIEQGLLLTKAKYAMAGAPCPKGFA